MRTILPILLLLFSSGCLNKEQKPAAQDERLELASVADEGVNASKDSLSQANSTSDTTYQEYMGERLKPIRANTARINGFQGWTKVDKRKADETAEGGSAEYYFIKDTLLKITVFQFAETGKIIRDFYTRNSELSFVLEKTYKYNRPMTWDSTAMKENHDTEVFDGDNPEAIVDESYFENGVLIRQINNQDCGSPFAEDYLKEEQVRLKAEFQKLKGRLKPSPQPHASAGELWGS